MEKFIDRILTFINKYTWILVFILAIPFINDGYYQFSIVEDWLMDNLKIVSFVIMLAIMFLKKRKPSLLWFVLLAMQIWWYITTIINFSYSQDEMFHKLLMDNINVLSLGLIVEAFKDNPKGLLSGLMLNFELCIYPEIITKILDYPEPMYYILGYYSVTILWMLPAVCVAGLYMYINKKYLRGALLILASIALIIMLWCATITVAFLGMFGVLILGYLLLKFDKAKNFKIPAWLLLLLAILGNAFVLFVYTGGQFPLIYFFIEKILGKSTTFTDRTTIWANAIRMIKESPIIGHGYRPEVLGNDGIMYIHAHNQLLQQLNARGIICLILFMILHIVLVIRIDKQENNFARIIALASCFGVWITYMTEAYKKVFRFIIVFFLAYHLHDLLNNKLNDKKHLYD